MKDPKRPFVRVRKPWRMDEQYKPLRDAFLKERDAWMDRIVKPMLPDRLLLSYEIKSKDYFDWLTGSQIEIIAIDLRMPEPTSAVMVLGCYVKNRLVLPIFEFPITHDGHCLVLKLAYEASPVFCAQLADMGRINKEDFLCLSGYYQN